MAWRKYLAYGVIAAALIAGVVWMTMPAQQQQQQNAGGGRGRFRQNSDAPVPTLATAARTATMPVYLDGVGTVRALNTVTVRSQVDGKLINLNFREGQDVERGEVLAQIDPTIYQAQYDQAVAKKAQDEALLANARRDLERYTRLAATNALPPQQADTQKSLVDQYVAQVKADQAAIDNTRGVLDYTNIVAPISGRIGIRLVDVGNIIHASDASGLLVITQLHPISVIFTLPQQQLVQVNNAFAKGQLDVEALASDNKTVADRGKLQVVDNQIDQATGTVRLKAEFPNPDLQLWPGQFVSIRLLVDTLKDVVVVPTAAVQRGPNGMFVYVVRDDDTVAMRPVTVSLQDENLTVVTTGVKVGDRVVTTSFNQLSEGKKVTLSTDEEPAASPGTTPAPSANRQRRRNNADAADAEQPQRSGRRSENTEGTSRTP
ncbi:MAG: efflux RND transporter periplasmic adaptor subunit [Xanthobacteraceae bacterium]